MEVITRAEARERGLKRFFSGKPCLHGHVAERYVSSSVCTSCSTDHNKSNLRKYDAVRRAWRECNADRVASLARERAKRWREANLDAARKMSRDYHRENRQSLRQYHAKWREANRGRILAQLRTHKAEWAKNPLYNIKNRVGQLVRHSLKSAGFCKESRTATILGCTFKEFMRHLELQFLPGMTWENRHLWHIDHIVPLATATTEADVLALNHFTNLRPLWGVDNLAKGAKQTHLL